MPAALDISGTRFGRLVARQAVSDKRGRRVWLCDCDCGAESVVAANTLRSGNTSSCGCVGRETSRATLTARLASRRRPLIDNGDGTHTVVLTRGKRSVIDSADAELVSGLAAIAADRVTGVRPRMTGHLPAKVLLLHRVITSAPPGFDVDHINGNGLDNRRSNLRVCTTSENCMNSRTQASSKTGVKGVHLTRSGKFVAHIGLNGEHRHLGTFATLEEAREVRARAAADLHGEFARAD